MDLSDNHEPAPRTLVVIPQAAEAEANATDSILVRATAFKVATRESFQEAATMLRFIKGKLTTLDAMRTAVTRPLLEAKRTVDEWFAAPLAVLRRAEDIIKNEMGHFERAERERIQREQREAEQRAREEQEELRRRAERAAAKGQSEKAADLTTRAAAVVAAPTETAPLKAKGVSFGEYWTYEITDASALPREFLTADHEKIRGVVKTLKGDTKISGVTVLSRPQVGARSGR